MVLHLKLYGCVAESCDGQERLFVLRLNVPVKNFSVMSGRSQSFLGFNQYFRELMCLAQGHNTVPHVGIEPRTSRFEVRHWLPKVRNVRSWVQNKASFSLYL